MIFTLLLCAFVALSQAEMDQLIVGGEIATYGDHHYICSLQEYYAFFGWYHICGSVIYNPNTVVTAAHCVDGKTATNLRVVCGNHRISQTDEYQQTVTVAGYTQHPQWSPKADGFPNDITVMRLQSPLVFDSHVNSIHFASGGSFLGETCKLSGWGLTEGGGSSANTLKKVNMGKISNLECSEKWTNISGAAINDGHICFFEENKSACNGDSGGPVRCGDTLTGVTSWGITSCDGSYPSVYTRISFFYNWIVSSAF